MKRFVITHAQLGVYLGTAMSHLLWSGIDPVGLEAAPTFVSALEAVHHIASWAGPLDGCRAVQVVADVQHEGDWFASATACRDVGLAGWAPDQLGPPGRAQQN